jgi:hypothetical protein
MTYKKFEFWTVFGHIFAFDLYVRASTYTRVYTLHGLEDFDDIKEPKEFQGTIYFGK